MATRVERSKAKNVKTLKKTLMILTAFMVSLSSAGYIYGTALLDNEIICDGVSINEVEVGNLTKEEAEKKLRESDGVNLTEKNIVLKYGNYSKTITYKDLGVKYDYQSSVERGYRAGREGGSIKKFKDVMAIKRQGLDLDADIIVDDTKVEDILDDIESNLNSKPVNATMSYLNEKFSIEEDKSGLSVDTDSLKERVVQGIGNISEITIPVAEEEAKIKLDELKTIDKLVGSYKTVFSASDANRNYNILLSSNAIDGELVMPGDVFSFNDATGLRNEANGYKSSIVIVGDEYVLGVGGGVCQTSSTLYNALAQTDIEIVERHNHSKPVSYVPFGQDATVADYSLDFKFKNNFDYPIFIKSDIVGNSVAISIYGK